VILLLIYLRFDAFRSIFPAGTVSGAPKIKAIELVYELEQERRGVYAGAVGRFDFANDAMDTCIAIRTTVFKDGVAYLQAGGGIVHDSVEEDEYIETINKLKGNEKALEDAERELLMVSEEGVTEYPLLGYWHDMQQAVEPSS
jgi:anthranilate synthase component I